MESHMLKISATSIEKLASFPNFFTSYCSYTNYFVFVFRNFGKNRFSRGKKRKKRPNKKWRKWYLLRDESAIYSLPHVLFTPFQKTLKPTHHHLSTVESNILFYSGNFFRLFSSFSHLVFFFCSHEIALMARNE